MIQFDKGGNNMRSCFALALYASILKKKKCFLSFCQNPGGQVLHMHVMGHMGWPLPKKGYLFHSPGIWKGSIGISQVEVFYREMKSVILVFKKSQKG